MDSYPFDVAPDPGIRIVEKRIRIRLRPEIEENSKHWSYVLLFRTSMSEDAPVMSPAVNFSPRSPKLYNIV